MKKILFVEDEVDHIAMLQTRLEASGYQFLSATDGEAGLKIALKEKPDLILLDIIMPKMNGYEMCYALKNNDEMKDTPIIVVTASGAKKLEQKCIESGVKEVIHKPYDSSYLLERIAFHLNN
jgi:CheY-like chemotaxis protein